MAVVNPPGTNTPDIVSTARGHLYAPPQNETLTYDLDGNLISDGRWQYTWNGENRLIKAEELVSPASRQPYTVEYAYDHQGRMVWKQVSRRGAGAQSWEIEKTVNFFWDGYNIVQALTHSQTHTLTNSFVWGLDLSGTLQGAGGVGGLLAEVKDGVPYYAASDANGNVTEYVSTDGTLFAHYEYSSFGEIVVQSGDLADTFTHRFSTKPWCAVTGLSEYEFRKYRPGMGRWLSRDPIGERGGVNLVSYIANDNVSSRDLLGLMKCTPRLTFDGVESSTVHNESRPYLLLGWSFFGVGTGVNVSDGGGVIETFAAGGYGLLFPNFGQVSLKMTVSLTCDDKCNMIVSRTGADTGTDGPVEARLLAAGEPAGRTVSIAFASGAIVDGSGGISISKGGLSIALPNARFGRSFQHGTAAWECQCQEN